MVAVVYTVGALLTAPIVSFVLTGTTWPGVAVVVAGVAVRIWDRHIYPKLPRCPSREWAVPTPGYIDTTCREVPPQDRLKQPKPKLLEGGR